MVMQLLKVMDTWQSDDQIGVIYTDVEKAFDQMPQKD
jgi:hypothetical protein